MNQQEKLAREWVECAKDNEVTSPGMEAAAEYILAHTTPSTMEGAEWDHEKHHMAGAYWEGDIPVVMIDPAGGDKTTVLTVEEEFIHEADDSDLVPNGKRYKLVEVPAHPEVLETVEDYENAPLGTIVAKDTFAPWLKTSADSWTSAYGEASNIGMADRPGTFHVLRWGDKA